MSPKTVIRLTVLALLASALVSQAQPPDGNTPAAKEKIWNLSEVTKLGTAPIPVTRAAPKPPSSVTIMVTFVVQEDGSVDDVRPARGTNDAYANATVEAVKKWKFKPGMVDGKPVKVRFSVPITFSTH